MSTTEDEEYEKQRKRLEAYRKRMETEPPKPVEHEEASAPYANGYYYMQETVPKVKDHDVLKRGKPVKTSVPNVKARGTTSSEVNKNEGCIIL